MLTTAPLSCFQEKHSSFTGSMSIKVCHALVFNVNDLRAKINVR